MQPTNIEECFTELKTMLSEKDIEFIAFSLNNAKSMHHSLGCWLRNQWGLWGGSDLRNYFQKLGLKHPDDMSGLILESFHYHLNGLPLRIEEQVKKYQEYWAWMSQDGEKKILVNADGSIMPVK